MTSAISKLTNSNCFKAISNKFKCCSKASTKSKIKTIAIETLKCLGLILAGLALGALIFAPGTNIIFIAGCVGGALAGGLAYFAAKCVIFAIKKFCYPAYRFRTAPAIPHERWQSEQNEEYFGPVLRDSIMTEPWYAPWKALHKFSSDKKAHRYLWRCIHRRGTSFAESYALVETLPKKVTATSDELLMGLKAELVYKHQIYAIIRSELAKSKNPLAVNIKETADKSLKVEKIDTLDLNDLKTESAINQPLKAKIQALKAAHPDKPVTAVVKFNDPRRQRTLFIQCTGKQRFYDFRNAYTGFHEGFSDEETFMAYLSKHIKARKFSSAAVDFFA